MPKADKIFPGGEMSTLLYGLRRPRPEKVPGCPRAKVGRGPTILLPTLFLDKGCCSLMAKSPADFKKKKTFVPQRRFLSPPPPFLRFKCIPSAP